MHITGDPRRSVWSGHPKWRLALQLLSTALTAFFVPLLAPLILFGEVIGRLANTFNTQITSFLAAIFALLIFRRITAFPGSRAFSFILPAFSTTFGVAAAVLLLLRIPYSGAMLLTGFLATLGISYLFGLIEAQVSLGRFYYVPSGNIGIVHDSPEVEWVMLTEPIAPRDPLARIVADLRHPHSPKWERMLAEAAISGIPVYHTKQLRESLTGRVQIEHLSENSFGSLVPALAYTEIKRVIDIVSSVMLLPILLVPMLVIGLVVRLTSPGPALFRQHRLGHRGKTFQMLKFRTMQMCKAGADGVDDRFAAITQSDDVRITPVGKFLRQTRLDELPQIINVLRGEMSWIGPRPEACQLSQWYEDEIPFYRYRHIVRPGITGWAQANQGHVAELDDVHVKLQYDFYYIKFFSFWLDVLIGLKTVKIMLTGFGAK